MFPTTIVAVVPLKVTETYSIIPACAGGVSIYKGVSSAEPSRGWENVDVVFAVIGNTVRTLIVLVFVSKIMLP